ncbi:enediyne polyketide synthase [Sphingobacterium zeae]|uniref:Enediyne polyketide synthase n=1 Tax=Sphingobacterium zeae TaxID=1776859 RepID=A0ABU0UC09_9SPHI|nr:SDR family NAD(P)-dependent oxidoreductase [Sphingobacterium zeae]MDQ1152390.1 enediyne polyketide synthase [Sphingobacterium zeae]
MKENEGVAIVGMDCRYPGANNINEFWDNIINLRQQFRRIPKDRLDLDYYYAADKSANDYTYSTMAAVLQGYNFDRLGYKIAKSTFDQTDMTHWMALDVATGALKDAGIDLNCEETRKHTGVIIGNSLTGEFTRANVLRLRWPYLKKVLSSTLSDLSFDNQSIIEILEKTEENYKSPFPVPDADMLAGGLSNTIAGRICNYYDFRGGGYTIDGACSSSLLAVANASEALVNGRLDVAIAGGVDLSIDAFELIGFARNGALASNEMEVFSSKSQGFWPGEGCGMIVLMRESYAKKMGYKVYATIKGWGISSDGMGGITRPKVEAQSLALKRAYSMAGYSINEVSMFEAHGTGTSVGDDVELKAIIDQLRENNAPNPACVGSIKQLIGHTKAAAGIAGLIKTVLSIEKKIIPPSKKYDRYHPVLEENQDTLLIKEQPITLDPNQTFKAGVSSFGFGGINVHITLEDYVNHDLKVNPSQKDIFNVPQRLSDEIFCFTGANIRELKIKLESYKLKIAQLSRSEFIDFSASLIKNLPYSSNCKIAIVANTVDSLIYKIDSFISKHITANETIIDNKQNIFYNGSKTKLSNAFLFPGQGSPIRDSYGIFKHFEDSIAENNINKELADKVSTSQHVIVQKIIESTKFLESFNISADIGIGHSLGEIACLSWTGVLSQSDAVSLAYIRGKIMSNCPEAKGKMLAVRGNYEDILKCTHLYNVYISGYNGIDNFVLAGSEEAIHEVHQYLSGYGLACTYVKANFAFHTPSMRFAAKKFADSVAKVRLEKAKRKMCSTVTGEMVTEQTDLVEYLEDHIISPVRFYQTFLEVGKRVDYFIEVGTGSTLSSALKGEHINILSMDYGADSISGLLQILAVTFIANKNPNLEKLFSNRFHKEFDLDKWELDVLKNPCELFSISNNILELSNKATLNNSEIDANEGIVELIKSNLDVKSFLRSQISIKSEIPVESILDEDRILSDLHINSLAISEIISLTVKAFEKDQTTYTTASLIANEDGCLEDLVNCILMGKDSKYSSSHSMINFESLPNWTHVFHRIQIEKSLMRSAVSHNSNEVMVTGNSEHIAGFKFFVAGLKQNLGIGSIFMSDNKSVQDMNLFLDFLKTSQVQRGDFLALVQFDYKEFDLKPILRTFKQEFPLVTVFSIDIEVENGNSEKAFSLIYSEIIFRTKYKEVRYEGIKRFESEIEYKPIFANQDVDLLKVNDIIIIAGGGKGITFESAKFLSHKYKLRLAIIGRSDPSNDSKLFDNLETLRSMGTIFKYYSADILDKEKIINVLEDVNTQWGHPVGILFGAGINKPKILKDLSFEDFNRTTEIKTKGIQNIISGIKDPKHLKLVIGFGSIISESGMEGNADYAWANDQFAKVIDGFSEKHKKCKALVIQWSIWDEVGMGVDLNSIGHLKKKGIWPIPVSNGLRILDNLISDTSIKNGRYIVSSRYGNLPTLNFKRKTLFLGRFVNDIIHHLPSVEIISNIKIDLQSDPYLKNHVLDGQYIFPTVMALEAMAQIGKCLHQDQNIWSFENLKINKPIFIPSDKSLSLTVVGTRIAHGQILVTILSEDSNFEIENFQVILSNKEPIAINEKWYEEERKNILNFNVSKAFYDTLLFHTGPFRKINEFCYIDSKDSIAEVTELTNEFWFDEKYPQEFLLGNPGINDAIIHCHQACRPSQRLLPTGVRSIYIIEPFISGKVRIQTREIYEDGLNTVIDVVLTNERNEILQYWKELVLTRVKGHQFEKLWDVNLLLPDLEYKLRGTKHGNLICSTENKEQLIKNFQNKDLEFKLDNNILSVYSGETDEKELVDKSSYLTAVDDTAVQVVIQHNQIQYPFIKLL